MEREAIRLRGGRRDEDGEDVTLLLPRAGGRVGLLQDDGRARAGLRQREELLHDSDHLRVVRRELERTLRGGERLERLLERAHVEPGELDLAGDAATALLEVTLLLNHLRGPFGVAGGDEEARESAERADVTLFQPEDLAVE